MKWMLRVVSYLQVKTPDVSDSGLLILKFFFYAYNLIHDNMMRTVHIVAAETFSPHWSFHCSVAVSLALRLISHPLLQLECLAVLTCWPWFITRVNKQQLCLSPSSAAVPKPVPAVCGPGGAEWGARAGGGGPEAGQPAAGKEPAAPQAPWSPRTQPQPRPQEGQL